MSELKITPLEPIICDLMETLADVAFLLQAPVDDEDLKQARYRIAKALEAKE